MIKYLLDMKKNGHKIKEILTTKVTKLSFLPSNKTFLNFSNCNLEICKSSGKNIGNWESTLLNKYHFDMFPNTQIFLKSHLLFKPHHTIYLITIFVLLNFDTWMHGICCISTFLQNHIPYREGTNSHH